MWIRFETNVYNSITLQCEVENELFWQLGFNKCKEDFNAEIYSISIYRYKYNDLLYVKISKKGVFLTTPETNK